MKNQGNIGLYPEAKYLDADGNLCNGPDGWARKVNEYYNQYQILSTTYYKADGSLFFNENVGYARMVNTYRESYLTGTDYYDENGEHICISAGYASIRYTYKNKTKYGEFYYDENGNPAALAKGCPGYAVVASNFLKTETWMDENGKPMMNDDGYAVKQTKINSKRV